MLLEVVAVGSELLSGVVDTNSAKISSTLSGVGAYVNRVTVVSDVASEIKHAVSSALERVPLVITTGGLGPTSDDVTKKSVAELAGARLETRADLLETLTERWEHRHPGKPMPESNRTQAEVPEGAELIPNKQGSAPALVLPVNQGKVIMLPGVPHEMLAMLENFLVPMFRDMAGVDPKIRLVRTARTTGVAESSIADTVREAGLNLKSKLSFYPGPEGVDVQLLLEGMPKPEASAVIEKELALLAGILGDGVFSTSNEGLPEAVVNLLTQRNWSMATAESCTGGMVGGLVTAVPGASAVFAGGVVAYSNTAKVVLLGVADETITLHGAVSEQVVREMVEGAAERLGTETAVSVTGIAGPGGGTPEKPVGTVWIGALCGREVRTERLSIRGPREWVRKRSAYAALAMIHGLLRKRNCQ